MFVAAISTLALVMAVGPQLQMTLQAAVSPDETNRIETESIADVPAEQGLLVNAPSEEAVTEDIAPAITVPQDTASAVNSGTITAEVTSPVPKDDASEAEILPAETPVPTRSGDLAEAEWPAILQKASDALTNAQTAKGKFLQTNADGSIMTGSFALRRPGRMRFDYDDPTPILIVSDGTTVAMEDSELETVDRVPLGSTPLGLILSSNLDFDGDVDVLGVMQNADRVGIRVSDATGELEGTLTMVFDKTSYELIGWLAIDGNLQTTVVDLIDVETNGRIDPRLFRLDEAQDEEDDR